MRGAELQGEACIREASELKYVLGEHQRPRYGPTASHSFSHMVR